MVQVLGACSNIFSKGFLSGTVTPSRPKSIAARAAMVRLPNASTLESSFWHGTMRRDTIEPCQKESLVAFRKTLSELQILVTECYRIGGGVTA